MDALLERGTLAGLAPNDNGESELVQRRFETRLGYGMPAFGGQFTGTPEIGLGLSGERRDYSLGWRVTRGVSQDNSLNLSLEARREENANDNADPVHEIGIRFTARF